MGSRIDSFLFGLTLPKRAAGVILRSPILIAWSVFPVAVTLGLYVYLIEAFQKASRDWVLSHFSQWGWDSHGFLAGAVLLMVRLAMFLVGAFTFSFAASLIASPFNDFLAEATESRAIPPLQTVPYPGLRIKARLILIDLAKTFAAALATLAAMLLSWIPAVNVVSTGIACLLVTFQFISYPQTRRGQGLGEGLAFLWRHFYASLGFGMILSFLFAIPFLACFAVPIAVVGGTLLMARAQAGRSAETAFLPLL